MAVNLPVDVRALYDTGKRLKEDRERPVRIAVLVEIDAPDALVEAARLELHPKTAGGIVDVSVIEPESLLRVDSMADACIVLVGSASHVDATLRDLRSRGIPTAVVALREEKVTLSRQLGHAENDVVVGMDPPELIRGPLADWAMTRLEKLRTPLAHNFEFVRRAVAREIVKKTAWQNAAIGVAVFVPGVDMPLMTLNQGKMLLQIAAVYGQSLDTERIKELGAVVAGGFLFRTFAREMVGLIPGLGWAVKGGIAYTGTIAMGTAAITYFEEGTDLGGVVRALSYRTSEAVTRAALVARHAGEDVIAARISGLRPAPVPSGLQPVPAPAPPENGPAQPTLLDVPVATPTLQPLETAVHLKPGQRL
jgi:uncharacterized protein (DUF697 family)